LDLFMKFDLPKLVADDARYRSGIRHYKRAKFLTQSDFIPAFANSTERFT
jgi:hypothetical protein